MRLCHRVGVAVTTGTGVGGSGSGVSVVGGTMVGTITGVKLGAAAITLSVTEAVTLVEPHSAVRV